MAIESSIVGRIGGGGDVNIVSVPAYNNSSSKTTEIFRFNPPPRKTVRFSWAATKLYSTANYSSWPTYELNDEVINYAFGAIGATGTTDQELIFSGTGTGSTTSYSASLYASFLVWWEVSSVELSAAVKSNNWTSRSWCENATRHSFIKNSSEGSAVTNVAVKCDREVLAGSYPGALSSYSAGTTVPSGYTVYPSSTATTGTVHTFTAA